MVKVEVITNREGKMLKVFDGLGQLRKQFNFGRNEELILLDLSSLPAGLYTVEIRDGLMRQTELLILE